VKENPHVTSRTLSVHILDGNPRAIWDIVKSGEHALHMYWMERVADTASCGETDADLL